MISIRQYYRLNCAVKIHMLKFQPPVLMNVTILGDRVFKDLIELKTSPLGWVLIQYDRGTCEDKVVRRCNL